MNSSELIPITHNGRLLAATHDERVADIHRERDVEPAGGVGGKVWVDA